MTIKEKLIQYKNQGKGILAANFYNFETLCGILTAANQIKEPIILQLSEGSIKYLGIDVAVALCKSAIDQYEVEGWLHLDHGSTFELAEACLKAGFDSVMIDGSEKEIEENINLTKKVVTVAKKYGAQVEAELGYIPKLGQQNNNDGFTSPQQARDFVLATGIDSLAIAIGTAHGFYKQLPKLDFERLDKIAAVTPAILVLHGGSGVPDEALQTAINMGITKINLATDSKNAFMGELKKALLCSDEIDLRKIFPSATEAVRSVIYNRISIVSMKNSVYKSV